MKILQVIDYETFGDDYIIAAKMCAEYADIIWFRIKDHNSIYKEAEKLRRELPNSFLSLSLNAEISSELRYQAVHLGIDSDVADVRKNHPELKIGYSAHSLREIESRGADYFTLSPIFFTKKDFQINPLGLVDVSSFNKEIYALGGINLDNAKSLKGLGFSGVAGISFYNELRDLKSLSIE